MKAIQEKYFISKIGEIWDKFFRKGARWLGMRAMSELGLEKPIIGKLETKQRPMSNIKADKLGLIASIYIKQAYPLKISDRFPTPV